MSRFTVLTDYLNALLALDKAHAQAAKDLTTAYTTAIKELDRITADQVVKLKRLRDEALAQLEDPNA